MPSLVIFTIIARNYLAHARVLFRSVASHHPEARRVVIIVDDPDGHFNPDDESFETVHSEVLQIPQSRWFHFKYSVLELSTAVKPYAFEWIAENCQANQIIYLDPDIVLFAPLTPLQARLETANLILTPHLTGELDLEGRPNEVSILQAGAYNLGFLAVSCGPESLRFLRWWQHRLFDNCVVDTANGLFVDQKWIDLVPGMYEGVCIERHPGCNVAYWNLPHRNITLQNGAYLVNGVPLLFFHFSGFDPERPQVISKHQDRLRMSDLGLAGERLFKDYAGQLLSAGFAECRRWRYGNSSFANGLPVLDIGRPLYKEVQDFASRIDDPFSETGYREIVKLWNTPVPMFSGQASGVTRLGLHIYRSRQDVQSVMPDLLGGDRVRFLEWLLSSGRREHDLFDELLEPVVDALAALQAQPENPAAPPQQVSAARITSLYAFIDRLLLNRPDLRRAFPDPFGADAATLLAWLSTYGLVEHPVAGELRELLVQQREELFRKLNPWRRLRLRAWMARLLLSAAVCRQIRIMAGTQQDPLQLGTPDSVAQGSPPPTGAPPVDAPGTPADLGVNLIGYLRTQNGVGQSARNAVTALRAAGIPFQLRNVRSHGLREGDQSLTLDTATDARYGINLYVVNADQTAVVTAETSHFRGADRYNVATWVWELSSLPAVWDSAFTAYDEIWAPSTYCQAAIAARSPVPVIHMPYVVTLPNPSGLNRADFGISADRFVFLAVFDMRSVFERKNPLAVISAFSRAFGPADNCQLIIKINHADAAPAKMELLQKAAAGKPVRLLTDTFPYADVAALMQASDCIVSLHRAEGFGFVMAEAMLLGKPVIATGYSGNIDFTLPSNSFLVGYSLAPVGPGCEPYDPEALWADPSEEDAVTQMRLVYSDVTLRRQKAAAGARFIRESFSAEAIGDRYRKRCDWIARRKGFAPAAHTELEMAR